MSSPVTNMYAPLQEDPQAHTNPFPNLHSPPTELRFTPLKLPLLSRHGPVNKSSTLTGGFTTSLLQDKHWDNDEYEDLEYIVIPADPPPAAGGRKRATATPKSAAAAPRSRKRGRNNTNPLPKRIKNEDDDDNDNDDDDIYRSEDPDDHGRRHKSARWTKQELGLMHELCREGKTGREIWGELRSKLGSTKSRSSVDFCRHRIKVSQVKWSDEDVEHLLQAVKGFDKYKAIACEFNKLAGRPEKGEPFGKGIIEFKMKSLEMEAKKSLKK